MSAFNQIIQPSRPNRLLYLPLASSTMGTCAYRIGFIGDRVDRMDHGLLGKVLEQRSFEPQLNASQQSSTGTAFVRSLLKQKLNADYPVDHQRVIAASLTGQCEFKRQTQLKLAVRWLLDQQVAAIFFQHRWIDLSEMQRFVGMQLVTP